MATYRLDVGADAPLWPDLKAYDGRVWKRFDAALLGLRNAVYEAMEGGALLDRPVAHELMAWVDVLKHAGLANGWTSHHEGGGFQFRLTRTA